MKHPNIRDCLEWLDCLDEGATIRETDVRFIRAIGKQLEVLADEIDAANAANAEHRRLKLERMKNTDQS